MISIDKKKCIHTNCNGSWFLLAVGTRIVSNGGNTLKKNWFFWNYVILHTRKAVNDHQPEIDGLNHFRNVCFQTVRCKLDPFNLWFGPLIVFFRARDSLLSFNCVDSGHHGDFLKLTLWELAFHPLLWPRVHARNISFRNSLWGRFTSSTQFTTQNYHYLVIPCTDTAAQFV